MSNTFKHKDKGKFHNRVLKYNEVCDSTKNMWDRHNSEYSEDKERRLQIKEKIAEKELKIELKEMITDKELLEWYYKGFSDELYGNASVVSDTEIKNRAYNIGANHAILGDEVTSFDSLSKEQILKIIKGEKTTL